MKVLVNKFHNKGKGHTYELLDSFYFIARHIRNRDKRGNVNSNGGATVVLIPELVEDPNNPMFISYCHINDTFDRRKGILNALSKFVQKVYGNEYKIHHFSLPEGNDTYVINIYKSEEVKRAWFTNSRYGSIKSLACDAE